MLRKHVISHELCGQKGCKNFSLMNFPILKLFLKINLRLGCIQVHYLGYIFDFEVSTTAEYGVALKMSQRCPNDQNRSSQSYSHYWKKLYLKKIFAKN